MKILHYFTDNKTNMHDWQYHHIYDELSRHGIEVIAFNPLDFENIKTANIELLKFIKFSDINMFMTGASHKTLFVNSIKEIKRLKIPTLLFCADNLLIPYNHKKICKYFDLVWLTSNQTKKLFERWGANTIVMPYAANPYLFKPHLSDEILGIVFVGSPYGSRTNIINDILNCKLKFSLFYNFNTSATKKRKIKSFNLLSALNYLRFKVGWKVIIAFIKQTLSKKNTLDYNNINLSIYPSIDFSEISKMYSKYALSLSSSAARNTGILKFPVEVTNLRSFEIAMSGGLQICQFSKELSQYFKEDEEILFYRNTTEMLEKIKLYLDPEMKEKREFMKKAARKRASDEHTWFKRFEKVFNILQIKI